MHTIDFPEHLSLRAPFGPFRAIVRRCVDADTIDVMTDLGFHLYQYMRLRIKGIDAPEIYGKDAAVEKTEGHAAKRFLEELILDMPVLIRTSKDPTTFGRYEAIVELVDGRDLATVLVEAGHATWVDK